jgi:hypothetical protein
MKHFLVRLFKRRVPKPKPASLFESYLFHYNGQMETMSGRHFLRDNPDRER